MGQHMVLLHAEMAEQRLLDIRLLQQAVGMAPRFSGEAEAGHVAGEHTVALGQRLAPAVPVPAAATTTIDQQAAFAAAGVPGAQPLLAEHKVPACRGPLL